MPPRTIDLAAIGRVIRAAKVQAIRYQKLTGRPLGITGEVAEYEAVRLLQLELSPVRQAGYDATYEAGGQLRRVQIKGRCVLDRSQRSQRLGRIDLKKEWDEVVLVILDGDFEPLVIYRAQRPEVATALLAPGSKARNERGALSISKFKAISQIAWSRAPAS